MWTRSLTAVALLTMSLALGGCAGAGLTLLGAGVAAGAGISYTLNGIAYKTYAESAEDVHSATLLALTRMGMDIEEDKATEEGFTLMARASEREIHIDLERVTERTTRMRVSVEKDPIFKDRATASEIIVQASYMLDNKVAQR